MTVEANYRLLKQGVSIDTEPLVKLVEQLKDQENAYYKNLLISEGVDVNDEQVELFREVDKKVSDMRYVAAGVAVGVIIAGAIVLAPETGGASLVALAVV